MTYGADGSTRTRTHEFVQRVLRETDLRVAPHLTCVGCVPREEVLDIAARLLAPGRTAPGCAARRCAGGQLLPQAAAIGLTPAGLLTRPTWFAACKQVARF